MKECFNLVGEKLSLSKTTMFLSFLITQRRLGRATFLMFLAFFLTGKVVHANINSLTEGGRALTTPSRERMAAQKPQTKEQWSRRWSMVSSSSLQKGTSACKLESLFFQLVHIYIYTRWLLTMFRFYKLIRISSKGRFILRCTFFLFCLLGCLCMLPVYFRVYFGYHARRGTRDLLKGEECQILC